MEDTSHRNEEHVPAWLDKSFIQKALRTGCSDSSISLTSCEVASAHTVGVGNLSDMFRVVAKAQGSKDYHLIIKCQPVGGQLEELVKFLGAFSKETQMMAETIPAMFQLLEDAKPSQYTPFSPKCFYHGDDPVTYVIMEDLKPQGFKLVDRTRGMDLGHATLAIQSLARFHASSVALHDRDPEIVERNKSPFSRKSKENTLPFHENAVRCLANEVAKWPGYEKYVSKLNKLQGTVYQRLFKVFEIDNGEVNVLNHGDTWTANMMFRYSGETLVDIRFVDFQFSSYGSPGLDIQYFLFSSPSDEVRSKHWDHLIQEYHTTFNATLNVLGCSERVVTLPQLHNTIKRRAFNGFIAAAAILPIALTNPENGIDFEDALGGDEDSGANNTKLYSNETYVSAMKRLLPLFDKEGLLD